MQRLTGDEFLGNLTFERDAMGTMSGHGFYSPEARRRGSNLRTQTVHPQGRTPTLFSGEISTGIDTHALHRSAAKRLPFHDDLADQRNGQRLYISLRQQKTGK